MKQKQILLVALLALIILAVMPVRAQTITMSDPDSTMGRDILVYSIDETGLTNTTPLYGLYNTSSIISTDGNLSYLFVLKPQYSTPLDDPQGFTDGLWAWFRTNLLYIVLLGVITAIFFKKG